MMVLNPASDLEDDCEKQRAVGAVALAMCGGGFTFLLFYLSTSVYLSVRISVLSQVRVVIHTMVLDYLVVF